jgi:hypothetical protein
MIRKSLFWGLSLLLVFALIYLAIRGHRFEKQKGGKPVEVIQESASTPIRVLGVKDLEIVHAKMRLEKESGGPKQSLMAMHEMEFRNKGKGSYEKIQLSIDYTDRRGKVLATKAYSLAKTIIPGESLHPVDFKIESLPVPTANCRIAIIYAELASAQNRQQNR